MPNLQDQMKQAVALAAVDQVVSGMVLGLGSGSTAALMIKEVGARLKDGRLKDLVGVTTSFQGEVLAAELGIPLLPGAWRQVQSQLESLGGMAQLRMAVKKAGPVVTDQGNLVLDVKFIGGIKESAALEATINNLPGVLENGLFINLTHQVLVGEIIAGEPKVRDLVKR